MIRRRREPSIPLTELATYKNETEKKVKQFLVVSVALGLRASDTKKFLAFNLDSDRDFMISILDHCGMSKTQLGIPCTIPRNVLNAFNLESGAMKDLEFREVSLLKPTEIRRLVRVSAYSGISMDVQRVIIALYNNDMRVVEIAETVRLQYSTVHQILYVMYPQPLGDYRGRTLPPYLQAWYGFGPNICLETIQSLASGMENRYVGDSVTAKLTEMKAKHIAGVTSYRVAAEKRNSKSPEEVLTEYEEIASKEEVLDRGYEVTIKVPNKDGQYSEESLTLTVHADNKFEAQVKAARLIMYTITALPTVPDESDGSGEPAK